MSSPPRSARCQPSLFRRPAMCCACKRHQTYLDLALRARAIDTVIISGGSTDVGVVSTIFSARDMDYNTIVVSDACGTSHDQRAHDFLMELIFPRMARVRTTDEVVKMIRQAKERL